MEFRPPKTRGFCPIESELFLPPGFFDPQNIEEAAEGRSAAPDYSFGPPEPAFPRNIGRRKTRHSSPFGSGLFLPRGFFGPQNIAVPTKPSFLSARDALLIAVPPVNAYTRRSIIKNKLFFETSRTRRVSRRRWRAHCATDRNTAGATRKTKSLVMRIRQLPT